MPAATPALMIIGVVLLLALTVTVTVLTAGHRRSRRFDRLQRHLATQQDLAGLRAPARKKETKVLHPDAWKELPPGQRIGLSVTSDRAWILQGWRELGVFVFGPGRGKTSGVVSRRVIEAPGANLMTSNKVDGVAEVIAGRKGRGEMYLFDPNKIYRRTDTPDFVYNPLWDVHTKADAEELAAIFEESTRKNGDRGGDAHFDTDGRNLLAYCFLAAALEDIPLATVYGWLAREEGHVAQEILQRHGHNGPATMIDGVDRSNERTKNSVYVTAQRMATALADDNLLAWTAPPDGVPRMAHRPPRAHRGRARQTNPLV